MSPRSKQQRSRRKTLVATVYGEKSWRQFEFVLLKNVWTPFGEEAKIKRKANIEYSKCSVGAIRRIAPTNIQNLKIQAAREHANRIDRFPANANFPVQMRASRKTRRADARNLLAFSDVLSDAHIEFRGVKIE